MPKRKTYRPMIGSTELARRLSCHPLSIRRFVKNNPGFPKPAGKLCGKTMFYEDEANAYIAKQLR